MVRPSAPRTGPGNDRERRPNEPSRPSQHQPTEHHAADAVHSKPPIVPRNQLHRLLQPLRARIACGSSCCTCAPRWPFPQATRLQRDPRTGPSAPHAISLHQQCTPQLSIRAMRPVQPISKMGRKPSEPALCEGLDPPGPRERPDPSRIRCPQAPGASVRPEVPASGGPRSRRGHAVPRRVRSAERGRVGGRARSPLLMTPLPGTVGLSRGLAGLGSSSTDWLKLFCFLLSAEGTAIIDYCRTKEVVI